jgi:hypothetical protein
MKKLRYAAHLLHIAEGRESLGKVRNKRIPWSDMIGRLAKPTVTPELYAAFLALPKEKQDELKNIAGYWIGAHCAKNRRKKNGITERNVITLDVDDAPAGIEDQIELGLTGISHLEFACHSTRKHTRKKPRLRLVFPLKHAIPADRYNAAARILASMLDPTMDMIDDVSFRVTQMMFWPTHSADSPFFFHHNTGILLDAGAMLDAWGDWHDHMLLPYSERQGQKRPTAAKAEDPTEKSGIVGAFCRAYDIPTAIETFLSDIYAAGDAGSGKPRFTYLAGSTSNGAVVEDDGRFLYSHHTSDPVSDRLCNSWDLVRIHLYGELDPEKPDEDTKPGKLPSWSKMRALAVADEAVLAEYSPHYEDQFTDDDVAEPVNGHANGHTNGHEDPEIAAILGLEPAIRVKPAKKKKLGPIERMNGKHAIVRMGGKTLAMTFSPDGKVDFGKVADLHLYYANQPMPKPAGGVEPISAWWLKHPERRTYGGGVVFAPGRPVKPDTYNLWTGFAVEPDPTASCRLFLDHILTVVCSGDQEQYRYVMGWFAHMIQRPDEKPGVALVLKGQKGAGKDTVAEYVGALFPKHYVMVNRMEQLTGKFNAHQSQALLLHVEEGFWAGDRAAAGSLQSVITAPTSLIEPKGIDPFMVDSFLRVFISSNEKWVVPTSPDERRYAVFNVSDCHLQDKPYFRALRAEMEGGGLGALLHHLKTFDLSDFDVRAVPNTTGLADQKAAGLKGARAFWYELLDSGDLTDDDGQTRDWASGPLRVGIERLHQLYKDWMGERRSFGHGQIESKVAFGRELQQLCPSKRTGQMGTYPNRHEVHKLPALATCRADFDKAMGSALSWEPIDDDIIG